MKESLLKSLALLIFLIFTVLSGLLYQKSFPHQPAISDEHGYVFLTKTFLLGRVTNPELQNVEFFETKNLNYTPTHHSKYPPGIAAPYTLFEFFGAKALRANVALFAVASLLLFLLLRSRMSFYYSMLGALFFSTNFRIIAEWVNGYRSGLMPMIGSILVLFILVNRKYKLGFNAFLFGMGASILMWTRPYEGLLLCLSTLVILALRKQFSAALKFAGPLVALSLSVHLYYNYATTGDALKHPHLHHAENYYSSSDFIFSEDKEIKTYSNERLKGYYVDDYERVQWSEQRNWEGFKKWLSFKYHKYSQFLLSKKIDFLALPLLILGLIFGPSPLSLIFVVTSLFFALLSTTSGINFYLAVLSPLFFLSSAELFSKFNHKNKIANIFMGSLFAILIIYNSVSQTFFAGDYTFSRYDNRSSFLKSDFESKLPVNSLVFIQYSSQHSLYDEWVINPPELETSPVIYALDKGEHNKVLLERFPERHAFTLKLDNSAPFKLEKIR